MPSRSSPGAACRPLDPEARASCRNFPSACCTCETWRVGSRSVPRRQVLDAALLAIVATQTAQSSTGMTSEAFWKAVAHMGGYLARRGDGPAFLENPVDGLASRPNAA